MISHPGYASKRRPDLAVLQLSRPVELSSTIIPACLPRQGQVVSQRGNCYISGTVSWYPVLQLNRPVQFSSTIIPACLPRQGQVVSQRGNCYISSTVSWYPVLQLNRSVQFSFRSVQVSVQDLFSTLRELCLIHSKSGAWYMAYGAWFFYSCYRVPYEMFSNSSNLPPPSQIVAKSKWEPRNGTLFKKGNCQVSAIVSHYDLSY